MQIEDKNGNRVPSPVTILLVFSNRESLNYFSSSDWLTSMPIDYFTLFLPAKRLSGGEEYFSSRWLRDFLSLVCFFFVPLLDYKFPFGARVVQELQLRRRYHRVWGEWVQPEPQTPSIDDVQRQPQRVQVTITMWNDRLSGEEKEEEVLEWPRGKKKLLLMQLVREDLLGVLVVLLFTMENWKSLCLWVKLKEENYLVLVWGQNRPRFVRRW